MKPHRHTVSPADTLAEHATTAAGLSTAEAVRRLAVHGPNSLPQGRRKGLLLIFLGQFKSPLIYVLLAAAVVAAIVGDWEDGLFIGIVLLVNALVGGIQEYNAQKSASALALLSITRALVLRDGSESEIASENVVPGDIVLLETGMRVPADLRLLGSQSLHIDESLLTGESMAVTKDANAAVAASAGLGDRRNMTLAGTMVTRGRGRGVCVATGLHTELGAIAKIVIGREGAKPPLLVRMERFTRMLSVLIGVACALVAVAALARGMPASEVFMLAVALAVAAIPEGLPVALTVALAIGVRRMSARRVIVRKLAAVEALGSCTFIASDKTGTLTRNELTVERIVLPGAPPLVVTSTGRQPQGEVQFPAGSENWRPLAQRLARAAALCNEGSLLLKDSIWTHRGDAVDVSLLVMAHKLGSNRAELEQRFAPLAAIAFESERQYAATLHADGAGQLVCVKGALERVLAMCTRQAAAAGDEPLDATAIERQAHELGAAGYRVMAIADGAATAAAQDFGHDNLRELVFLGLVATIDPLRQDAAAAIAACAAAGVAVAMVTGDHPVTALAIARKLGLAKTAQEVVTGPQLARATEGSARAALISGARVFARVEPAQKLQIVTALQNLGHFVAVTGDGANDAPALRQANVGVAMGASGTDVARESADLVIADDAFGSIVGGIEEGRIAYGNVRKVVTLLVSTGAAEILLFLLATAFGTPVPLLAVQLLWLNLVTNGIQDVTLAFEPGEGNELKHRPRPPGERIFNRPMIETVLLTALVMGGIGFGVFQWMLASGYTEYAARNGLLMLMVLFENIQVGNCRSETRSGLTLNPLRNWLLLAGTIGAQLLHVAATYTPGLRDVLRLQPVTLSEYALWLALALVLFAAIEVLKLFRRLQGRET
ncbi:MAG: HAD-IC family P-type ATPase [Planctomycetes bacterium]|nr:HAD-IC family P-type ATPase [Planctomycetota bacterium]